MWGTGGGEAEQREEPPVASVLTCRGRSRADRTDPRVLLRNVNEADGSSAGKASQTARVDPPCYMRTREQWQAGARVAVRTPAWALRVLHPPPPRQDSCPPAASTVSSRAPPPKFAGAPTFLSARTRRGQRTSESLPRPAATPEPPPFLGRRDRGPLLALKLPGALLTPPSPRGSSRLPPRGAFASPDGRPPPPQSPKPFVLPPSLPPSPRLSSEISSVVLNEPPFSPPPIVLWEVGRALRSGRIRGHPGQRAGRRHGRAPGGLPSRGASFINSWNPPPQDVLIRALLRTALLKGGRQIRGGASASG